MVVYSVRKLFTGLAIAALIAWKLIVTNATVIATIEVIRNTSQLIFVLYANSCNQVFIIYQASGEAIRIEIPTSFRKSLDNNVMMPDTLDPNTFLMPISFVLCSALNIASPNKPRHEIKIAITVKYPTSDASRTSPA